MIMRIYALYGGNTTVLVGPGLILATELVVMGLPLYLLGRTGKYRPCHDDVIADRRHCQVTAEN